MIEACCDAFSARIGGQFGGHRRTPSRPTLKTSANSPEYAATQGVTDIHAVDAALLRSFLAHLEAQDLARASRARKTASLRSFFAYLARQRLLPRSPALGLRSVKTERRLPKFLRPDEIESLLAAPNLDTDLGLRDRALLETLYASGMRAGELVTLGVADVDLRRGHHPRPGQRAEGASDPAGAAGRSVTGALSPESPSRPRLLRRT